MSVEHTKEHQWDFFLSFLLRYWFILVPLPIIAGVITYIVLDPPPNDAIVEYSIAIAPYERPVVERLLNQAAVKDLNVDLSDTKLALAAPADTGAEAKALVGNILTLLVSRRTDELQLLQLVVKQTRASVEQIAAKDTLSVDELRFLQEITTRLIASQRSIDQIETGSGGSHIRETTRYVTNIDKRIFLSVAAWGSFLFLLTILTSGHAVFRRPAT